MRCVCGCYFTRMWMFPSNFDKTADQGVIGSKIRVERTKCFLEKFNSIHFLCKVKTIIIKCQLKGCEEHIFCSSTEGLPKVSEILRSGSSHFISYEKTTVKQGFLFRNQIGLRIKFIDLQNEWIGIFSFIGVFIKCKQDHSK